MQMTYYYFLCLGRPPLNSIFSASFYLIFFFFLLSFVGKRKLMLTSILLYGSFLKLLSPTTALKTAQGHQQ